MLFCFPVKACIPHKLFSIDTLKEPSWICKKKKNQNCSKIVVGHGMGCELSSVNKEVRKS